MFGQKRVTGTLKESYLFVFFSLLNPFKSLKKLLFQPFALLIGFHKEILAANALFSRHRFLGLEGEALVGSFAFLLDHAIMGRRNRVHQDIGVVLAQGTG